MEVKQFKNLPSIITPDKDEFFTKFLINFFQNNVVSIIKKNGHERFLLPDKDWLEELDDNDDAQSD